MIRPRPKPIASPPDNGTILRCVACTLAIILHIRHQYFIDYAGLTGAKDIFSTAFYGITRIGQGSVSVIFFAMSGFAFGAKHNTQGNTNSLESQLSHRFKRLATPLAMTSAYALAIAAYTNRGFNFEWLLAIMLGQNNFGGDAYCENGPLWYLGYEFSFAYIIYTTSKLTANNKTLKSASQYKIESLLPLALTLTLLYNMLPHYFMCWGIGAMLSRVNTKIDATLRTISWMLIITSLLAIQLCSKSASLKISAEGQDTDLLYSLSQLTLATSTALLLRATYTRNTPAMDSARTSYAQSFAKASYAIYLTHIPTTYLLTSLFFNDVQAIELTKTTLANFVGLCACAIIIGYVFHSINERYFKGI